LPHKRGENDDCAGDQPSHEVPFLRSGSSRRTFEREG
jgi:hypothetical protein